MSSLPFRQIHLDFHTTEEIKGIGSKFSKEQFQKALKLGHVDSITVFSKCHHGWAYHPSKANEIHPHLAFDLLGEMIAAAHEIGVKTPVYISAGLDEKMARRHPEWLIRKSNEETTWIPDFLTPGYHKFCMNTPYLDYLLNQVDEVLRNYDADGIFLDIVGESPCYCQYCVSSLRKSGKDPRNEGAVVELSKKVYANYVKCINDKVNSIKPGLRIFHNSGHIHCGRRDLAFSNTHLELESLPTGGWGYDHFPMSARYVQTLGMEFLGMTGKFHTTWGEFGGFKHPNALRYEAALSIANGARCSIGDQLHPEGLMDEATYSLIGKAYCEVEQKEPWCVSVNNIADVALLSHAAFKAATTDTKLSRIDESDTGASRILLEEKILYDIIDLEENFSKYKVIILPDNIRITNELNIKLQDYFKNGGRILATGFSGLNSEGSDFVLDLGVKSIGLNPYKPDYFKPLFALENLYDSSFVFYSDGQKVELTDGTELARREEPYFNRSVFAFCSHQHTPNSNKYGGPGMVESKIGIYIPWKIFEDYATKGSLILKEVVLYALSRLIPKKSLVTNLPAQGVTTLMEQKSEKRYINHLLYASPVRRGVKIEVIEDIIPIYNVEVTLSLKNNVKNVYLAPQMEALTFEQIDDKIRYVVPKLECHQMVVIDY